VHARAQSDVDPKAREATATAMQARAAADTTAKVWTRGGVLQLNMTQVALRNWAAGGLSSVSGIVQLNAFANKKKGRHAWDNSVALAFGGLAQEGRNAVKTDDRLELNSKYGYELKDKWYLAALAQFRTQFTEGFDAATNSQRISNFLAPGYLVFGLGLDYKPNENFTFFVSPITARLIFVNDEKLFEGLTEGDRVYGVEYGNTTEMELGGYVRTQYQKEVAKNITFLTRADFFSNYLRNPQNIDINWETLFTFKVNNWFAATLGTLVIYDHDTPVAKFDSEGVPYTGPETQIKQTLGLGVTLKL
ncbi:MAG TPA: DUF3078 domain-containing protein, partial [Flavobacteriales bacterium]